MKKTAVFLWMKLNSRYERTRNLKADFFLSSFNTHNSVDYPEKKWHFHIFRGLNPSTKKLISYTFKTWYSDKNLISSIWNSILDIPQTCGLVKRTYWMIMKFNFWREKSRNNYQDKPRLISEIMHKSEISESHRQ